MIRRPRFTSERHLQGDLGFRVWSSSVTLLLKQTHDTTISTTGDRVVVVLYISPNKFIYFLKHPEDPDFRVFR